MTGEDLGYKAGVAEEVKFAYSPLGAVFNKIFKKDDKVYKVNKYDDDLEYNLVHNFNKYSVSKFKEILSIDSKFDTLNKFYKDFKTLESVESQNQNTKQKKINVLKNVSLLYNVLINLYKKEYNQVFKSKEKNWRLNMPLWINSKDEINKLKNRILSLEDSRLKI